MMKILNFKRGFTLAETLITLMIIGVVAVLVIPAFVQNVNEKTLTGQRKAAANKIAEGFSQMRVAGALNENYTGTAAFVNAMKKYFKINQVCETKDTLKNCFPETVSSTANNETTEYTVADMEEEDVIGIIFADGVNMLIKYNPEGNKIEEGDTQTGKIEEQKDDNGLTYAKYGNLIYYRFDANGMKTPNKIGSDIIGNLSLAPKGINDKYGLGFEILGDTVHSSSEFCTSGDCWADADAFCKATYGNDAGLPSKEQLDAIANAVYGAGYTDTENCTGQDQCSGFPGTYDANPDLGGLIDGSGLWSNVSSGYDSAYRRYFYIGYSFYDGNGKRNENIGAVCVK